MRPACWIRFRVQTDLREAALAPVLMPVKTPRADPRSHDGGPCPTILGRGCRRRARSAHRRSAQQWTRSCQCWPLWCREDEAAKRRGSCFLVIFCQRPWSPVGRPVNVIVIVTACQCCCPRRAIWIEDAGRRSSSTLRTSSGSRSPYAATAALRRQNSKCAAICLGLCTPI